LQVLHRFADNSGYQPSGYAISNVLDLANFAIMQMHYGVFQGKQVLAPTSVREMQTPQADLYLPTRAEYGLTLHSEYYKGVRLVWHDGDVTSFLGRLVMVPEAHLAVIILMNWPAEITRLFNATLDDLLHLPSLAPAPDREKRISAASNLAGLTGWYLGRRGLAKILLVEDHLALDFNGEGIPLHAYRQDGYIGLDEHGEPGIAVGFPSAEPDPPYLLINGSCYTRIAEESLSRPDPSTWEAYVGTYTAIFDTWTVRIQEGQLIIQTDLFGEEMACRPLDRTRFTCGAGMIEFGPMEAGKASCIQTFAHLFTRMKDSS
jgi:hypothetical protein